ncbi:MAG: conjugal transfer protein TraR [Streptosporangiales bacterium]|nr:conjugal transfer protein TraR [Streptosporangiales bacterium]
MDTACQRERLKQLLDELDGTLASLRSSSVTEMEAADAGTGLSDNDRSLAMVEAVEQQRTQTMEALGRLDEGTYGQCVDCGKPVPEGRLEARPEAARCVDCQQKVDRATA